MPLPTASSYASVGGEKTDYYEVVDPTTDLSFEDELNITRADCAAMTRTATRGWVTFDGYAGDPTVSDYEAVWGGGTADAPTVSQSSTGVFVVTLPESILDERGNEIDVSLQSDGWVNVAGSTLYFANTEKTGPNTVRVRVWDNAGDPSDAEGAAITVWCV